MSVIPFPPNDKKTRSAATLMAVSLWLYRLIGRPPAIAPVILQLPPPRPQAEE